MMRRCALLRGAFDGVENDRNAVAQHHLRLLDRRHWELATPSSALSVIDVLLRSGVHLDGLERSAAAPLWAMMPTMTTRERTLVHKVSALFMSRQPPVVSSHAAEGHVGEEESVVSTAYAVARSTGACSLSSTVDAAFVQQLRLPFQLMLLELLLSRHVVVTWVHRAPPITKELLDAVCNQLSLQCDRLPFETVWWLLMALSGDARLFRLSVPPPAGRRLFGLCVRRVHQLLPDLSVEQRLLLYLVLTAVTDYEKPFIVLGEIEKLALATPPEAFDKVSSRVLLHFMSSSFAVKHAQLNLHMCVQWCNGTRVADFDCEECLLAFSVVASLHAHVPSCAATAAAPMSSWELLHESLFAQVFLVVGDMSAVGCLSVLDQAELMNVSGWGVTVPQVLLEKLKRRLFSECKDRLANEKLSSEEAETLLRVVLGVQALMQRFTVLPYSAADEQIVAECVSRLERYLSQ